MLGAGNDRGAAAPAGSAELGRVQYARMCASRRPWAVKAVWLRANGFDTNGAAAKFMYFDRLGKKARPDTFGKIKVA